MSDPADPSPAPPPTAAPLPPAPPARAARVRDLYDREEDDSDDRPRRRRPAATGLGLSRAEGVLPRGQVRMACFVVLTLSLLASGVLCILAVWGAATSEVAWRAVTSLGIVAAMAAGFTVLNEVFGRPPGAADR